MSVLDADRRATRPRGSEGTTATGPPVSLEELRRAWAAVQGGEYRLLQHATPCRLAASSTGTPATAAPPADEDPCTWTPGSGETVLPLVGCVGSAGASTLAVALADAAALGRPAWDGVRVVDCASPASSGLVPASRSELGPHRSGRLRGSRDQVVLERPGRYVPGPAHVPPPCPPGPPQEQHGVGCLSVIDAGWDLDRLLREPSWLRERALSAEHLVLVTTATVRGLRRLEVDLDLLRAAREATESGHAPAPPMTVHATVLGPPRRRWPRPLHHELGPRARDLDRHGHLTVLPHDRDLAVTGLGPAPLPAGLLVAASQLLDQLPDHRPDPRRDPHRDVPHDFVPVTDRGATT